MKKLVPIMFCAILIQSSLAAACNESQFQGSNQQAIEIEGNYACSYNGERLLARIVSHIPRCPNGKAIVELLVDGAKLTVTSAQVEEKTYNGVAGKISKRTVLVETVEQDFPFSCRKVNGLISKQGSNQ